MLLLRIKVIAFFITFMLTLSFSVLGEKLKAPLRLFSHAKL